jgi:uncharacterized protein YbcI
VDQSVRRVHHSGLRRAPGDRGESPDRIAKESGLISTAGQINTRGELEAAICTRMVQFQQEYMGRGPKDIRTHLIDDLLVVRLRGVLTAAEQHLAGSLPGGKGRELLKQVRSHLMETARPLMEEMVQEVAGIKVLTLHHDISTVTGEEVVLFTLAEAPRLRETSRK